MPTPDIETIDPDVETIDPDVETIDDETLAQRVACGAIVDADVVGRLGGWGVVVTDGQTSRILAGRRGSLRLFRRFEVLVAYLRQIGVVRFRVDASGYSSASSVKKRATSAEQIEAVDEAAAHDRWFRAQVSKTLRDIERGEVRISTDDEHRARWRRKRADMLARSRRNA